MTPHRLTAMALRVGLPRRTARMRLTLGYGGLFVVCGAALLAVTYGLVVHALVGNTAGDAVCEPAGGGAGAGARQPGSGLPGPGSGCHAIGAGQARALALQGQTAVLHELLTRSEVALVLMAVVSIVLGWFVAGRVLRPLRTITAAARQISAASLGERLSLGGPRDELRELGDTFDQLLARLEASFAAQRQFIANAAHELRTPLARQRVISQVALADAGASTESLRAAHERVLASGTQQQELIDALLTLARGQAGPDKRELFDLAGLASKMLAARQSEASDRKLALHAALGPAPATGSPRLTERLVANLVDNALRYNVPGGRVEVSTGIRDSCAVLAVANTGPTVPAAAVDRLFQPFQRLAAGRARRGEGLGLGLSIVQAIAHTHGASITACPQPEGGLQIEVTFPAPHIGSPSPIPHSRGNFHAKITAAALTSAAATELSDRHPGIRRDKLRHPST